MFYNKMKYSSYVSLDIIKRILKNYFGINVTNLMNITDVDDKIINKALQEKKSIQEVSEYYEKEFFSDLESLNCERPSMVLNVTTHIPEIVEFIQDLIRKEHAYATKSGSVYFRTERLKIKSFFTTPVSGFNDLKENKEKENEIDFALWKAIKTESEPGWKSPWGTGRPGSKTIINIF
jgi:cysteinyl-tRNA synthetase